MPTKTNKEVIKTREQDLINEIIDCYYKKEKEMIQYESSAVGLFVKAFMVDEEYEIFDSILKKNESDLTDYAKQMRETGILTIHTEDLYEAFKYYCHREDLQNSYRQHSKPKILQDIYSLITENNTKPDNIKTLRPRISIHGVRKQITYKQIKLK